MKSTNNIKLNKKASFLNRFRCYLLYQRAFPRAEKKPYRLISKVVRKGYGSNFIIENEAGDFLGLAFTISNGDFVLLDYLAIDQGVRGGGIGTQTIELLKKMFYPLPIVLEIEDPEAPTCHNREERIRRADFYARCGMKTMAYRISLFGVDMKVLSSSEDIPFERYHSLLYQVFGEHFSRNVYLLK